MCRPCYLKARYHKSPDENTAMAVKCHPDRKHKARGLCDVCWNRVISKVITSKTRMADCHPDRKHDALGLCSACYTSLRAKRREELPHARPAPCHPERAYFAKDMCRRCYSSYKVKMNPISDKASKKKYYLANKDLFRLRAKEWRDANPEKFLAKCHRYRARKREATVADCEPKIKLLSFERFCHWCCKRFDGDREIDHVVPLSRGGKHIPDNLVAACKSCNSSKCNKLISEWSWTPQEIDPSRTVPNA